MSTPARKLLLLGIVIAVGCGGSAAPADAGPVGLPILGNGTHAAEAVQITEVATEADGLLGPRDLAFHPSQPNQLWVVNQLASATVILFDPGTPDQIASTRAGDGSTHFMARPMALAFGTTGFLATAQEEDQITQPETPADFMGPTLWTSNTVEFNGGHASHYDMLHNSPSAVGIAWEQANVYWVVDGRHRSFTRYDFRLDHGPGGEDHMDGVVARYAAGEFGYVPGTASHAEIDHERARLYVADSGNNRVAVMDLDTGARGVPLDPNYDGSEQFMMDDAEVGTLVDGAAADMSRPSGLALSNGTLFVTDNALSRIVAFDLEGHVLDWLDLSGVVESGGLMGIEVGPAGDLWIVDAEQDRVLRVAPRQ